MVGPTPEDGRRFAPSAERNSDPILAVLRRVLPAAGLVLEIASGTGQHVVHFARGLPALTWQPTDADPASRESVRAWVSSASIDNVRAPIALDVCERPWPIAEADAVLCINMIHIAPPAATTGLLAGASDILTPGGVLVLYGPYRRFGRHTAPSNEQFDAELRARNPDWGVRDMEAVLASAADNGFALDEIVEMPANNFAVVLRRT